MLALATFVVTSCSAPRMAQQSTNDDDVYNTTAKAKIYTPAPIKPSEQVAATVDDQEYAESDYYGTSDPYYDMDYSSRINRFYYSSPWRTYYDPYFYSGWYPQNGWSIGFSPFYNNYWNSPYSGWGNAYSPFWGWNNSGWNNYYYGGGYYGGGFLGGGYYGGGYYGGGFYTGRTTNVQDYRSRPGLGRENGVGSNRNSLGRAANGRGTVRSDDNGNVISRRGRAATYDGNNPGNTSGRTSSTRPAREQSESVRPTRGQSNTAPARQPEATRPAYTPPARSSEGSSGSSRSSGSGSGSSSSGSRPARAGRG